MSRRTEMLGSMIQRELAVMILRDLQDPRLTGFPTVTRVKVSPDLAQADVYVTVMGTPGQQTAALNALKHSAGLMRSKLTRSLTLRVAPFLKFHMDESLKKELAVLDLIRKASAEEDELARLRSGEPEPSDASDATDVASDSAADESESDPESGHQPAGVDAVEKSPGDPA